MILAVINLCLFVWLIALLFRPEIRFHDCDRDSTVPLRVVLILFVILTHVKLPASLSFLKLGTPAVNVFLFLSGFGLSKSLSIKGQKYLRNFELTHLVKLMLPYCICVLLWFGLSFIVSRDEFCYRMSHIGQYMQDGNLNWLLPHSWYPWTLLIFSCMFSIVSRVSTCFKRCMLIAVGVIVYYCIMRFGLKWMGFWYFSAASFAGGIFYAEYEEKIQKAIKIYRWKLLLIMAAGYSMIVFGDAFIRRFALLPTISGLLLAVLLVTIHQLVLIPRSWIVYVLGTITYEIYLLHGVIYDMVSKSGVGDVLSLFILLLIVPFAALVIQKICHKIRSEIRLK